MDYINQIITVLRNIENKNYEYDFTNLVSKFKLKLKEIVEKMEKEINSEPQKIIKPLNLHKQKIAEISSLLDGF